MGFITMFSYKNYRFLYLFVSLWCAFAHHQALGISVHTQGILTPPVQKLFALLGQRFTTLSKANAWSQKNLLRHGERWENQEDTPLHSLIKSQSKELNTHLNTLGIAAEIAPPQDSYAYALVMGGTTQDMVIRFNYLLYLVHKGIKFENIVLLGSERQLKIDEKKGLPDSVVTEMDMICYLYSCHQLFDATNMVAINSPMKPNADGSWRRPSTDDTIRSFIQESPEPGSCLLISHAPYIARQTKVAQRFLNQTTFPTDGAGPYHAADCSDSLMLMDEFARLLYEEYCIYSHAR